MAEVVFVHDVYLDISWWLLAAILEGLGLLVALVVVIVVLTRKTRN